MLEYAVGDKLYVPLEQVDRITRYVGPDGDKPRLTRLNTADWTEKDGYYYYTKPLKPGEVTAPIFTAVTFKADMGNEYQNATATVDVFAQAVQTANNGATVMDAQGWPKA